MDPRKAYKQAHTTVPGWFHAVDLTVFEAVDRCQRSTGVTGAVLEIGVFQGASAVLLGFLVDRPADLVLCDPFETDLAGSSGGEGDTAANVTENATYYEDLAQQTFETNYLRFHAALPDVRRCTSGELDPASLPSMRVVHIDGSHLYDFVRADLRLSRDLLVDGGVVIIDDYRSEHAPGPAAATWAAVASEGLIPICITPYKLYGLWAPHPVGPALGEHLRSDPALTTGSVTVGPHDFVRAMAPPDLYSRHLRRQRLIRRCVPPIAFDMTRRVRRTLRRSG